MNKPENIKRNVIDDPAESLIEGCLANDRKAQIEIYNRYVKSIFNVSFRMVNDKMLAEDLTQEAFISAFKGLNKFRREVSFYTWLKKIVINKSLDELRRQKVIFTELKEEHIYVQSDDDKKDADHNEILQQIKKELFNLPDGYRIIISLYYLEGYNHEEISQILNISSSTSRSQLTRAKRLIIKRMNKSKSKR